MSMTQTEGQAQGAAQQTQGAAQQTQGAAQQTQGAAQQTQGATQGAQTQGATQTQEQNPQGQTEAPKDEAPEAKIARLEGQLRDLRKEQGRTRTEAKTQAATEREREIVETMLGALGYQVDGKKPVTTADLQSELDKVRAENTSFKLAAAVRTAAGDADPERLLKHTDFLEAVKGLDPNDVEGIKAAVTTVVSNNPYLRSTGQAPGRSGAEMPGGTGESSKSLQEQIAEAEKAGDVKRAIALKTRQLMGS